MMTADNNCSEKDGKVIQMENVPPGCETMGTTVSEEQLVKQLQSQHGVGGFWSYIKKAGILFANAVGYLVMAIVCVVLPPAMVVMGSLYLERCPVDPYIPIYLVVEGVSAMTSAIFFTIVRIRKGYPAVRTSDKILVGIASLFLCFTMAWFIVGCTWVYRMYKPSFNPELPMSYCDPALYLFAFWICNTGVILVGSALLFRLVTVAQSLISSKNKLTD